VAVLALAVLAAALVKLVSDANTHGRNTVVLVQTPAPAAPTTSAPAKTAPPAPAGPPTGVALAPATMLTSTAATLNGTVNPQGVPTTYQFRYRAGASHPWAVSAGTLGASGTPSSVTARIDFLTPATTYHYKLTALKAGHPVNTPEATFTTLGKSAAQPAAPAAQLPARARLSAPAKRRLAELEARLRASKFPSEQQQLRLEEQRVLAGG
jgi:hypothetical protein